jgi:hypothetical protein
MAAFACTVVAKKTGGDKSADHQTLGVLRYYDCFHLTHSWLKSNATCLLGRLVKQIAYISKKNHDSTLYSV